jgi:hypothetical protein
MNVNVYFVGETIYPPNVQQARSIENLWDILAQKIYREDGRLKHSRG